MATGPISFVGGVGGLGPQRIGTGKSIPLAITRYFRRNEGTTDYAQFAAPITLAGDFEIETDVLIDSASDGVVIGNSGSVGDLLLVRSNGSLRFRDTSATDIDTASGIFTFGVFAKLGVRKVGTNVDILMNGTVVGAGVSTQSTTFDILYKYASGLNAAGILANLKIWDNGVLVTDCPIDEPSGATIFDKASGNNATIINGLDADRQQYTQQETGEWLGQEEFWTYGVAESTGSEGTFNVVGINGGSASALKTGVTYRGTMTTSGLAVGELRLKIGTDSASIRTSINETVTSDVTPAATNLEVITGSSQPNAGASGLISTREVLNVA
tara:strand:+ start:6282 stop:7262 length:981 start_codon:yes stop_codon:yes gene_type:complete